LCTYKQMKEDNEELNSNTQSSLPEESLKPLLGLILDKLPWSSKQTTKTPEDKMEFAP
jgi:hypothetical protein